MHMKKSSFVIVKPRKMTLAGLVAHMGENRNACRFSCGNLKERDHLEDLGIDVIKMDF
jgi:hypothetical protein